MVHGPTRTGFDCQEIQQQISHGCVTTVQSRQLLASMLGEQLFLLEDGWLSKGIGG